MNLDPRQRLIVALDFASADQALSLVEKMGDTIECYKIGLELFSTTGPEMVKRIKAAGKWVTAIISDGTPAIRPASKTPESPSSATAHAIE